MKFIGVYAAFFFLYAVSCLSSVLQFKDSECSLFHGKNVMFQYFVGAKSL